MKPLIILASVALAAGAATIPLRSSLLAEPGGGEQGQMRRATQGGSVRSLREIERQILPTMPGMQYLGPEYDAVAMAYRLKFIKGGRVIYVDVDGRTGRVIGESH